MTFRKKIFHIPHSWRNEERIYEEKVTPKGNNALEVPTWKITTFYTVVILFFPLLFMTDRKKISYIPHSWEDEGEESHSYLGRRCSGGIYLESYYFLYLGSTIHQRKHTFLAQYHSEYGLQHMNIQFLHKIHIKLSTNDGNKKFQLTHISFFVHLFII